ncbi:MAG: hypothetical protein J0J15_26965, partial [Mesorhizobium sp.]|nr:hypothetical protein [Mesorhizobium sp.]
MAAPVLHGMLNQSAALFKMRVLSLKNLRRLVISRHTFAPEPFKRKNRRMAPSLQERRYAPFRAKPLLTSAGIAL